MYTNISRGFVLTMYKLICATYVGSSQVCVNVCLYVCVCMCLCVSVCPSIGLAKTASAMNWRKINTRANMNRMLGQKMRYRYNHTHSHTHAYTFKHRSINTYRHICTYVHYADWRKSAPNWRNCHNFCRGVRRLVWAKLQLCLHMYARVDVCICVRVCTRLLYLWLWRRIMLHI